MYRTFSLPVCAVVAICAAAPGAAASQLKGQYAFTGEAACLFAPSGFGPNPVPNDDKIFSSSYAVIGVRIFNGDGTGTVRGRAVGTTVPPTPSPPGLSFKPGAGSDDFSFSVTDVQNPDGSFTSNMVPGSFSGTFLTGPRAGQTYSIDNIPPFLIIAEHHSGALIAAHLAPAVETVTYSNGDIWPRICHRSRVLLRMEPADR
jgi:hypothetical protein